MQVCKNAFYIFIKTVPLQISAKPLFVPIPFITSSDSSS
ncbi:hypothetical protein MTR67_015875 [Solanum verrucosum]|uniref:Uncharacterized protein n=1 Tax=Solanum verrucosum TaxID=315347 RepID=A0AAF0QHM4_SOLVR|nr:hypothetical protein MTR67_015875 [Solanum verrucosum]